MERWLRRPLRRMRKAHQTGNGKRGLRPRLQGGCGWKGLGAGGGLRLGPGADEPEHEGGRCACRGRCRQREELLDVLSWSGHGHHPRLQPGLSAHKHSGASTVAEQSADVLHGTS